MAIYTVFEPLQRDSAEKSLAFPIAHRTRWTAKFNLLRVPAGGSIEMTMQVSPTSDEKDFVQLFTFGSLSAEGTTEKKSTVSPTPDFTITERDKFWRAVVLTQSGIGLIYELILEAAFLDVNEDNDLALLSKELRLYEDRARLVIKAERDVVDLIIEDRTHSRIEAWVNAHGFLEAMKDEIAAQAEWAFGREQLMRKKGQAAQVTLRSMGLRNPDIGKRLKDFRPQADKVWLGRG